MKKIAVTLMLLCFALTFSFTASASDGGLYVFSDASEVYPGGRLAISVGYDSEDEYIGAFLISISYNSSSFEYLKAVPSAEIKSGDYMISNSPSELKAVFSAKNPNLYSGFSGDAFTFYFDVSADAAPEVSDFIISVSQLSSTSAETAAPDSQRRLSVAVKEAPSDDARLMMLLPETGTLEPAFDPDIYNYYLEVPYKVNSLVFGTTPIAGAQCRVNRKNLGSGGSTVDFIFTVTAENGKDKAYYTVSVHRDEKTPDASISSPFSPSPSSSPESSEASTGSVENKSDDSRLLSLIPPYGTLDPQFSPDIYSYNLTVPYSVTSMQFETEPAQKATCRVNRKNLGSGGSTVDFIFTVSAENGKNKSIYTVTVLRESRPSSSSQTISSSVKTTSSAKATSSPKTTSTAKPSSSPKASSAVKSTASSKTGSSNSFSVSGESKDEAVPTEQLTYNNDGENSGSLFSSDRENNLSFFLGAVFGAGFVILGVLLTVFTQYIMKKSSDED